jgi:hypothetical protein
VDWFKIQTKRVRDVDWLRIPAAVRGDWLALAGYCAAVENGGRLVGAKDWDAVSWALLAVSRAAADKLATHRLASWDGADLVIADYDVKAEAAARNLSEANTRKVEARWEKARGGSAARNAPGSTAGITVGSTVGSTAGNTEKRREEKKREEERREEAPVSAPAPLALGSSLPVERPIDAVFGEVFREATREWMPIPGASDVQSLLRIRDQLGQSEAVARWRRFLSDPARTLERKLLRFFFQDLNAYAVERPPAGATGNFKLTTGNKYGNGPQEI